MLFEPLDVEDVAVLRGSPQVLLQLRAGAAAAAGTEGSREERGVRFAARGRNLSKVCLDMAFL